MEVNSSPGLEGIERCTQLDIAGAIIDYIAAQVDFPEIDLRQRLTVSRGYGVAEIHIPEGSEYVGKTIQESGLREKDINVLTLYRGTTVIPNPRSDGQLEPGDRLLCFGKLELMRDLVPAKTRRQRRPEVQELPDLPVADEVLRCQRTPTASGTRTGTTMTEARERKPIDEWFGETIPAGRIARREAGRQRELQQHDGADSASTSAGPPSRARSCSSPPPCTATRSTAPAPSAS